MSPRALSAALGALLVLLPAGGVSGAPVLPAGSEMDLGWFDANTQSDFFLRVSTARPAGVLRIGIFGESNAAGVGVGDGEAFPAQLEREFRSRGIRNVQVVSFAVGGYGAHQAHMLYRAAAEDYGLDVVVFCFWPFLVERDTSFLTPWSQDREGSMEIHARYILADGGLRKVSLPGVTRQDSARRYWSRLPLWADARYSRQTPLFIRRLLPKGRRLVSNPFYYDRRRSAEEEALETYRLILQDLARRGRPVVAWYDPGRWGSAFRRTALSGTEENVIGVESRALAAARGSDLRSLFNVQDGHLSAAAHRNIAAELFAVLTGRKVMESEVFSWDPAAGVPDPGGSGAADLHGGVRAELRGRGALRLMPLSPKVEGFAPLSPGAAGLLLLRTHQPLFYVLDAPLRPAAGLSMRLTLGAETVSVPLGVVSARGPLLGLVRIPEGELSIRTSGGKTLSLHRAPDLPSQPCWRLAPDRPVSRAALRLDDRIVVDKLEIRTEDGMRGFCAAHLRAGALRLQAGAYASFRELTRTPAPLDLVLGQAPGARRVSLGRLSRVSKEIPSPATRRSVLDVRTGPSGRREASLSPGFRTP